MRPRWKAPLARVFVGASIVSLMLWAILISLILTGHTKVIWTAQHAAKATVTVARKAHRAIGKLQGDKDLTLPPGHSR